MLSANVDSHHMFAHATNVIVLICWFHRYRGQSVHRVSAGLYVDVYSMKLGGITERLLAYAFGGSYNVEDSFEAGVRFRRRFPIPRRSTERDGVRRGR